MFQVLLAPMLIQPCGGHNQWLPKCKQQPRKRYSVQRARQKINKPKYSNCCLTCGNRLEHSSATSVMHRAGQLLLIRYADADANQIGARVMPPFLKCRVPRAWFSCLPAPGELELSLGRPEQNLCIRSSFSSYTGEHYCSKPFQNIIVFIFSRGRKFQEAKPPRYIHIYSSELVFPPPSCLSLSFCSRVPSFVLSFSLSLFVPLSLSICFSSPFLSFLSCSFSLLLSLSLSFFFLTFLPCTSLSLSFFCFLFFLWLSLSFSQPTKAKNAKGCESWKVNRRKSAEGSPFDGCAS